MTSWNRRQHFQYLLRRAQFERWRLAKDRAIEDPPTSVAADECTQGRAIVRVRSTRQRTARLHCSGKHGGGRADCRVATCVCCVPRSTGSRGGPDCARASSSLRRRALISKPRIRRFGSKLGPASAGARSAVLYEAGHSGGARRSLPRGRLLRLGFLFQSTGTPS